MVALTSFGRRVFRFDIFQILLFCRGMMDGGSLAFS